MGVRFSATARNKLPSTSKVKLSTVRKAFWKSQKQAGLKAIRTHPVLSARKQDKIAGEKTGRRLLRASVGRALDMQGIFDRETRGLVQAGVQRIHNTKNREEERAEAKKMVKTLKSLTTDEFKTLMRNVEKVQLDSILKLRRLR